MTFSLPSLKSVGPSMALCLLAGLTPFSVHAEGLSSQSAEALKAVIAGEHRAKSSHRDQYRHPFETLSFFGVEQDMKVAEIAPGGGWYTRVLGPYLNDQGHLYAAHFDPKSSVKFFVNTRKKFVANFSQPEALYGNMEISIFHPPTKVDFAPAASLDRVLTFRNVHNWYMRGGGDARVSAAFDSFYKALKPGGILGVVEHQLAEERPLRDQETSGYMKQSYVIQMAEQAGFELVGSSDVNKNPADHGQHPKGVWTLPPSLRLGETNQAKYLKIGESNRMTLAFKKPE